MTNQNRRDAVHKLRELVKPLRYDLYMDSYSQNYLMNMERHVDLTPEQEQSLNLVNVKMDKLIKELAPLESELSQLEIWYQVKFEHVVMISGIAQKVPETIHVKLATDYDGEIVDWNINLSDPDVQEILAELKDYMIYNVASQFTITSIKKV